MPDTNLSTAAEHGLEDIEHKLDWRENIGANDSANPTIGSMIEARLSRRAAMLGIAGAGAAATLAGSRASTGRPVNAPSVDFRLQPTSSGLPSVNKACWCCSNAQLCAGVLPNPMPGSSAIRSAATPAACTSAS
jgi:hypothetical protein